VLFITMLGTVLKHLEKLDVIVSSLETLIGDSRLSLASIPAFIGLLPMPGGAMMSAPLVNEFANRQRVSSQQR